RVCAGVKAVERDERGERAVRGDSEKRAVAAAPALACGAIEIAVTPLNQSGVWVRAIGVIERVQRAQLAGGGDFEDRAVELVAGNSVALGRAVEIAIGALNQ